MNVDQRVLGRVWDLLRARDSRPLPTGLQRPTLSIKNLADGATELRLYAEIGFWGITAQQVADQLDGRRGDLHVRINSPGGDVFDGYAVYNMLAAHPGRVTVTVEGLAASAASFIAMAGAEIRVCLASQMMIHDASGVCMGNAAEMREWADVLDSVSDTIAAVYAERAGGDAAGWREVMRGEKWYTPQEAVDAGLADELITADRKTPGEPEPDEGDPTEPGEPDESMGPGMAAAAVTRELVVAAVVEPSVDATAVGPHSSTAKDGTWDKAAEEGRLPSPVPLATARKFYAAYDEDQAKDGAIPKSAGMLPHHFVSTDGSPGAASVNGVNNALARLSQTKGLSEAERATVERHLRGHLPSEEDHHAEDHEPREPAVVDITTDPAAPDSSWVAAVAHLTAPTPAPSTVDELLNVLAQKGIAS